MEVIKRLPRLEVTWSFSSNLALVVAGVRDMAKKGKDPDVGILKMTIFCFSKLALRCTDCNF